MRSVLSVLSDIGLLLVLAAIGGCGIGDTTESAREGAAAGLITGHVFYRERIALQPDAVIRVALEDVSRADALATILAEQTIRTEGRQVPIPFALDFDATDIESRNRYVVRAEIRDGEGRLLFTTMTSHPVLESGAAVAEIDVLVERVSAGRP